MSVTSDGFTIIPRLGPHSDEGTDPVPAGSGCPTMSFSCPGGLRARNRSADLGMKATGRRLFACGAFLYGRRQQLGASIWIRRSGATSAPKAGGLPGHLTFSWCAEDHSGQPWVLRLQMNWPWFYGARTAGWLMTVMSRCSSWPRRRRFGFMPLKCVKGDITTIEV